jgi:plastocyanin
MWAGVFAYSKIYPDSIVSVETTSSETKNILIQDHSFQPASITVSTNTIVIWKNKDGSPHTVTATDESFDSHMIVSGKSYSYQFTKAGTYNYYCKYHSHMTGVIIVQDFNQK